MTQTPADWYPDPDDDSQLRYWDGKAWTEHRHPKVDAGASGEPAAQTSVEPSIEVAAEPAPAVDVEPAGSMRADIAAARSRMTTKVGGGREIRKLVDHLWEGETVEWLATGTYGGGTGLLTLTNLRLFFLKDGVMKQTSEDFPLSKISSIQWSSGMLLGKIQVFVSGNKAEIVNVSKLEGKAIVDSVRAFLAGVPAAQTAPQQVPAPVATAPAQPAVDPLDQLAKLGALRDQGILTEEEFAAKKKQILGL